MSKPNAQDARSGGANGRLRRNADFINLWIAESISQVGSQVSLVALPLLAILTLDAKPAQMGFLTAAGTAPFLLLGLFAGVWVDRLRRRPLMIGADVLRGLLLLIVPVSWWFDLLSIELLYIVAFVSGSLTLVFEVAWLAYLPSVVERRQLVDANSKLHASASVAQVSGPGVGGLLVGIIGAPLTIFIDAVSYFASAVFLVRIRRVEPNRAVTEFRPSVLGDIRDGLGQVFRDRVLRALIFSKIVVSFSAGIFFAVYLLFMSDTLGMGPTVVGIVLAMGGIGALGGAAISEPLSRRIGIGKSVVGSQFFFGLFGLTIPLAVLVPSVAVAMVVLSELVQWMAYTSAQVNEVSIRQSLVPDEFLGRVGSVFQFFGRGMTPIGAISGGLLGESFGLSATLVIASAGFFVAFMFVVVSPVSEIIELDVER